jgi:hypothetical protein
MQVATVKELIGWIYNDAVLTQIDYRAEPDLLHSLLSDNDLAAPPPHGGVW